jgi:hypothetical protein
MRIECWLFEPFGGEVEPLGIGDGPGAGAPD